MLDAPPDFGQANKFLQRGVLGQGQEPITGRSRRPGGPFGEEPLHRQGTVAAPGKIAVRWPDAEGNEPERHRGKPVIRDGCSAVPPSDLVQGRSARSDDEVFQRTGAWKYRGWRGRGPRPEYLSTSVAPSSPNALVDAFTATM